MKWLWALLALALAAILVMATFGWLAPATHLVVRRARFQQKPEAVYAAIAAHRPPFHWTETAPPLRCAARVGDDTNWTFDIAPVPSGGSMLQVTVRGEIANPVLRFAARYITGYQRSAEAYLGELAKHFNEPLRMDPVTPGRGRR